jgi:hypothetical protein
MCVCVCVSREKMGVLVKNGKEKVGLGFKSGFRI